MCGRYKLARLERLDDFGIHGLAYGESIDPRWNVSPGNKMPVVVGHGPAGNKGGRAAGLMEWGFIPHFAREPGTRPVNARAEGIATSGMFKHAFYRQRCLVPADGFYEWDSRSKQAWLVERADGRTLAFAGLWDKWLDRDGNTRLSFCILTTPANEYCREIQERMPVVLDERGWDIWTSAQSRVHELEKLLVAPGNNFLYRVPVGKKVGDVQSEGPECAEPLQMGLPVQLSLFRAA
jgi:putative SOS response-associated peptidase YedK